MPALNESARPDMGARPGGENRIGDDSLLDFSAASAKKDRQRVAKNKTPWWWKVETETPTQKFVLGALVQFYNVELRRAWPSHQRLSIMTGYSVRTVGRAIKDLAQQGLVEIEPHFERTTRKQHQNRYCLPKLDTQSRAIKNLPVEIVRAVDQAGNERWDRYDSLGNPLDSEPLYESQTPSQYD